MELEGSLQCSEKSATGPHPEPDQHRPNLLSYFFTIQFNIIPRLRLSIPSGILPSGFPTKTLHAFLFALMSTIWPVLLVFLDLLPIPAWVQMFLSTLFSNTLNLCSSLHVRDQVLHPYKTKDTIILLCNLVFMFVEKRLLLLLLFALFNVCSSSKNCPSARCATAANVVCTDVDVFGAGNVHLNKFL
jgi:hypothetical protein